MAFAAVMFQVDVFWVVTLCSVVVGQQRFGGPCCLHFQGSTKVDHVMFLFSFSVCSLNKISVYGR